MPICFKLLRQEIRCACALDLDNAGNSIAARMAMMAITTSSSIKVKAGFAAVFSALAGAFARRPCGPAGGNGLALMVAPCPFG